MIVAEIIKRHIKLLLKVNLLKTVYFNFHYFPFKTAIRLPIYIYRRSELYKMKGRIVIDAPIYPGMVIFGSHELGTQDILYSRTMWEVYGTIIFRGSARIGRGCKISVGKDATLSLGNNFTITGKSEIICQNKISFGSHCLLSWDILMMDTDFHRIVTEENVLVNAPKPITVGDHVWVGCRSTILKGVSIADNTIIAAGSTISRTINDPYCVIGGQGRNMEVLRRNVRWRP